MTRTLSRSALALFLLPLAAGAAAPVFSGRKVGTVASSLIREASGLAASRKNADVFWVHNDSGDPNRLFAMTSAGRHLGIYTISGASAADWEDIAVGPGPAAGVQYLYIGDVGDNGRSRSSLTIYRVPEPSVSAFQSPANATLSGAVALRVKYPDGKYDCETLMADPANGDLYLVTKHGSSGSSRVYRYPAPHSSSSTATLQYMRTVQFGDASSSNSQRAATGGEISPTGSEILIRTYAQAHLWPRQPGQSVWSAFGNARTIKTLISEPQGEAICFSPDGWDFYTVSEGSSRPIYLYERSSGPPPSSPVTRSFQDGVSPTSGYGGTRDAFLAELAPGTNYGGASYVEADGDEPSGSGRDRSGLLRWSVTDIPPGSTVQSARISVHVSNPSGGMPYQLYGLKRDWDEYQATWNQARSGSPWEIPGARGGSDRSSTVLGTLAPGSTGTYDIVLNASGVALVQSWVNDPGSNKGVLIANPTSSDGVNFASRQDGTGARRPKLTVTYVAP